jgi:hypothetical protein
MQMIQNRKTLGQMPDNSRMTHYGCCLAGLLKRIANSRPRLDIIRDALVRTQGNRTRHAGPDPRRQLDRCWANWRHRLRCVSPSLCDVQIDTYALNVYPACTVSPACRYTCTIRGMVRRIEDFSKPWCVRCDGLILGR